jgi:hypothetical protein
MEVVEEVFPDNPGCTGGSGLSRPFQSTDSVARAHPRVIIAEDIRTQGVRYV